MAWFKKVRKPIEPPDEKSRVPEGLWVKCPSCGQIIYNKDLAASLASAPSAPTISGCPPPSGCGRCSTASGKSTTAGCASTDPLTFTDTKPYRQAARGQHRRDRAEGRGHHRHRHDRRHRQRRRRRWSTGSSAAAWAWSSARRSPAAIERAIARRLPAIIVSCSGGARMMEGALSLMQMAKISGALARLDRARLPYISLLTDPTTGGVTASFAMLGDLNIAEPKALIGFAGPRVIEQTIRQKLPEGFQRSEFLLEHGMLDIVVDRRELKDVITRVLRFGVPAARRRWSPRPPPRRRRSVAPVEPAGPTPARLRADGPARLPLQPRTPRDEVRPREHAAALRRRSAIPNAPSARSSSAAPTARARSRPWSTTALHAAGLPRRPLHLPAPRPARRALRHRRHARSRPTICAQAAGRCQRRRRAAASRDGALQDAAHVLRVRDRDRVRAVPRRRRRRSRCSKSASAAASTPPTSSRRSPRPSPRSTSITRRSSATTSTSIAFEKAGIIKPGIPVVCGPLPAEAERVIGEHLPRTGRPRDPRARPRRASRRGSATASTIVSLRSGHTLASTMSRWRCAGGHQIANAAVAVCLLDELARLASQRLGRRDRAPG